MPARPRSARPRRRRPRHRRPGILPAPAQLVEALEAALGESGLRLRPLGGGDINDAYAVERSGAEPVFVKTRDDADPGEFEAEAAGLRWLADGEVGVPEVLGVGSEPPFLALRYVEPGRLSDAGAERFGRGLARLHGLGARAHGWLPGGPPQRLGSVTLDARPGESWARVYAEQRLLPLARMARDGDALDYAAVDAVVAVCDRIDELAGPREPPARLHGDLWSGNVHADEAGEAWLIDPAAHGGHREMDLAMLRLFGVPGEERIFAAYEEATPLAEGYAERIGLWQLQPLLVHAVLFGGHYGSAAERAARRYL